MSRVSVIIPARKEKYLELTLEDLYEKRRGQIEVIVVLDGWVPNYEITEYPRLKIIKNAIPHGMRNCINAAVEVATGKYIMKLDAHCQVGHGWDIILQQECEDNWIVIPRRYALNAPLWCIDENKEPVDAMAYLYPHLRPYAPRLTCRPWEAHARKHKEDWIFEDMGFQGSCWFMAKEHFTKRIGPMDARNYGTFGEEPQELGLKTQLGPWEGKIMRNKKTWYAHWSKPSSHWRADPDKAGRVPNEELEKSYLYAFDYWYNNRWGKRAHNFEWLIEKFWPLPGWPENWKWLQDKYDRYEIKYFGVAG